MDNNKNILIIEDDISVSNVIVDILTEHHYHVLGTAKNKKMCHDLITQYHNEIDLILLDINLMNGSDGISCLLESYKQGFCRNTPVLYVSGNNDSLNLKRISSNKNSVGFVVKPFHEQELLTQVEMAFIKSENSKLDNETHLSLLLAQILNENLQQDNTPFNQKNCLKNMLTQFGNLLKSKRKDLRQTQAVAAETLNINYRHYQDVESGKVNLRMETFLKILNYIS